MYRSGDVGFKFTQACGHIYVISIYLFMYVTWFYYPEIFSCFGTESVKTLKLVVLKNPNNQGEMMKSIICEINILKVI